MKGIALGDSPLLAVKYLLRSPFLASDRARIAAYSITSVMHFMQPGALVALIEKILSNNVRTQGMKITVYKQLIRILVTSPTAAARKLLRGLWFRKELHRDCRIAVLSGAYGLLRHDDAECQTLAWEIFESCAVLEDVLAQPEVIFAISDIVVSQRGTSDAADDNMSVEQVRDVLKAHGEGVTLTKKAKEMLSALDPAEDDGDAGGSSGELKTANRIQTKVCSRYLTKVLLPVYMALDKVIAELEAPPAAPEQTDERVGVGTTNSDAAKGKGSGQSKQGSKGKKGKVAAPAAAESKFKVSDVGMLQDVLALLRLGFRCWTCYIDDTSDVRIKLLAIYSSVLEDVRKTSLCNEAADMQEVVNCRWKHAFATTINTMVAPGSTDSSDGSASSADSESDSGSDSDAGSGASFKSTSSAVTRPAKVHLAPLQTLLAVLQTALEDVAGFKHGSIASKAELQRRLDDVVSCFYLSGAEQGLVGRVPRGGVRVAITDIRKTYGLGPDISAASLTAMFTDDSLPVMRNGVQSTIYLDKDYGDAVTVFCAGSASAFAIATVRAGHEGSYNMQALASSSVAYIWHADAVATACVASSDFMNIVGRVSSEAAARLRVVERFRAMTASGACSNRVTAGKTGPGSPPYTDAALFIEWVRLNCLGERNDAFVDEAAKVADGLGITHVLMSILQARAQLCASAEKQKQAPADDASSVTGRIANHMIPMLLAIARAVLQRFTESVTAESSAAVWGHNTVELFVQASLTFADSAFAYPQQPCVWLDHRATAEGTADVVLLCLKLAMEIKNRSYLKLGVCRRNTNNCVKTLTQLLARGAQACLIESSTDFGIPAFFVANPALKSTTWPAQVRFHARFARGAMEQSVSPGNLSTGIFLDALALFAGGGNPDVVLARLSNERKNAQHAPYTRWLVFLLHASRRLESPEQFAATVLQKVQTIARKIALYRQHDTWGKVGVLALEVLPGYAYAELVLHCAEVICQELQGSGDTEMTESMKDIIVAFHKDRSMKTVLFDAYATFQSHRIQATGTDYPADILKAVLLHELDSKPFLSTVISGNQNDSEFTALLSSVTGRGTSTLDVIVAMSCQDPALNIIPALAGYSVQFVDSFHNGNCNAITAKSIVQHLVATLVAEPDGDAAVITTKHLKRAAASGLRQLMVKALPFAHGDKGFTARPDGASNREALAGVVLTMVHAAAQEHTDGSTADTHLRALQQIVRGQTSVERSNRQSASGGHALTYLAKLPTASSIVPALVLDASLGHIDIGEPLSDGTLFANPCDTIYDLHGKEDYALVDLITTQLLRKALNVVAAPGDDSRFNVETDAFAIDVRSDALGYLVTLVKLELQAPVFKACRTSVMMIPQADIFLALVYREFLDSKHTRNKQLAARTFADYLFKSVHKPASRAGHAYGGENACNKVDILQAMLPLIPEGVDLRPRERFLKAVLERALELVMVEITSGRCNKMSADAETATVMLRALVGRSHMVGMKESYITDLFFDKKAHGMGQKLVAEVIVHALQGAPRGREHAFSQVDYPFCRNVIEGIFFFFFFFGVIFFFFFVWFFFLGFFFFN